MGTAAKTALAMPLPTDLVLALLITVYQYYYHVCACTESEIKYSYSNNKKTKYEITCSILRILLKQQLYPQLAACYIYPMRVLAIVFFIIQG